MVSSRSRDRSTDPSKILIVLQDGNSTFKFWKFFLILRFIFSLKFLGKSSDSCKCKRNKGLLDRSRFLLEIAWNSAIREGLITFSFTKKPAAPGVLKTKASGCYWHWEKRKALPPSQLVFIIRDWSRPIRCMNSVKVAVWWFRVLVLLSYCIHHKWPVLTFS